MLIIERYIILSRVILMSLIELRIQVHRHLTPSIQKCMCANSQFVVNSSSIISIIIWSVTPNVRIFDRGTPLNNRTLFAVYVTTFLLCIASCAPLPHQPPTQTPFGLVTKQLGFMWLAVFRIPWTWRVLLYVTAKSHESSWGTPRPFGLNNTWLDLFCYQMLPF